MASVQINIPDFVHNTATKIVSMANDPHVHAAIAVGLQAIKGRFPSYAGVIDSGTAFFAALAVVLSSTTTKPTETK